jgi:hypothetical protein
MEEPPGDAASRQGLQQGERLVTLPSERTDGFPVQLEGGRLRAGERRR